MEEPKTIIAFLAVVISAASSIITWDAAARARKADAIKQLLGEKESVAFAALRLLRDGLAPNDWIILRTRRACWTLGLKPTAIVLFRWILPSMSSGWKVADL